MINSFAGDYHFLSNFYPCEVSFDGVLYPSVEHAYQASKTLDLEQRKPFQLSSLRPGAAKRLGKTITLQDNWNKIKLLNMGNLIWQKFDPEINPSLAEQLIATGTEELIEGNWWGDAFWGVCNGKGENHLGKILMARRQVLIVDKMFYEENENGN